MMTSRVVSANIYLSVACVMPNVPRRAWRSPENKQLKKETHCGAVTLCFAQN